MEKTAEVEQLPLFIQYLNFSRMEKEKDHEFILTITAILNIFYGKEEEETCPDGENR